MKLYKQKEWLRTQYINNGLSLKQIGDICGVCLNTIRNNLIKTGIERRRSGPLMWKKKLTWKKAF